MNKQIRAVKKFHKVFNHSVRDLPTANIPEKEYKLRFELITEEASEYLEASKNGDVVEVADALGDLLYVLYGTILVHGMQDKIQEVFDEIQRSNMSKLGEDGLPVYREDGKIIKGQDYFSPNIAAILGTPPLSAINEIGREIYEEDILDEASNCNVDLDEPQVKAVLSFYNMRVKHGDASQWRVIVREILGDLSIL